MPCQSAAAPSGSVAQPAHRDALGLRGRSQPVAHDGDLADDQRLLLVRLEAGRAQPVGQVGRPVVPVVLPLELAAERRGSTSTAAAIAASAVGLVEVAPEDAAAPAASAPVGGHPQHRRRVVEQLDLEARLRLRPRGGSACRRPRAARRRSGRPCRRP